MVFATWALGVVQALMRRPEAAHRGVGSLVHEVRQAPVLGLLLVEHDPHEEGRGGQVADNYNEQAGHQQQPYLGCLVVVALEAPQQEGCRSTGWLVNGAMQAEGHGDGAALAALVQWETGKKGYCPTLTCKATVAGWSGGVCNAPSHLKKSLQAFGMKSELRLSSEAV